MELDRFIGAFLPLFVAINIPGILPIYVGMVEDIPSREQRQLLVKALTVAFVVAMLMLFAGEVIFATLGITVHDLRVGGGLILLIIAITDLAFGDLKKRRGGAEEDTAKDTEEQAVVPLGIPLIIGPGAITTILVAQGQYGYVPTLTSVVLNMLLVFAVFLPGPRVLAKLGPSFSKAVAKIASLFLAAIAVAMIKGGVMGFLNPV